MARILMVDDDEMLLRVTADYLESRGHKVTRCCDSTQAAEILEKIAPEIAIVDYEMPKLKGPDLLTEMRSGGRGHNLPVIFLSAVEALLYASQVPPDPRVRFLRKPVELDELEGAISALLDPEGWSRNA